MDVVYAQGSEIVTLNSGQSVRVMKGQHWPATDQVVKLRPELFTTDPRFGLLYTEAPPGYDANLNEVEQPNEVEAATSAPGEKRHARRH